MDEDTYQIVGLIGFIVSGGLFLVSGLRTGDGLLIAGCLVWTAACCVWLAPLVRRRRG